MTNFVRRLVSRLVAENADDYEEFEEELPQPGDPIDVEVGDRVKSIYGRHWVTATDTVNGLWTSERKQDIETGQGRGLRLQLVKAVRKSGSDTWIPTVYSRDAGSLVVAKPQAAN